MRFPLHLWSYYALKCWTKLATIISFVPETVLLPPSSSGEMAQVRRSVSEALWAMCAADSMSMPVHWYYDISDIKRDFGGWISGLNSPRVIHPSSILSLSNTSRITLRKIIARSFGYNDCFNTSCLGFSWKRSHSLVIWSQTAGCCR